MRIRAIVFAMTLLAAIVLGGAANAYPTFSGKFTLPYEVHWGHAVLPAGDYTMTMEPFESAARVRAANGKIQFIPVFPSISDSLQGGTFLYVTSNGSERTVRCLNLPRLGKSLVYEPLTKPEREAITRRDQPQAVQVAIAEK